MYYRTHSLGELRKENAEHGLEKVGAEIRSNFSWCNGQKLVDRDKN